MTKLINVTTLRRTLWLALALVLAGAMARDAVCAGPPAVSDKDFKGRGVCRFATHGFVLTEQTEKAINGSIQKLLDRHKAVFGFQVRSDFHVRLRIFGQFEDYTNATFQLYWTNAADQQLLRGRPFNVAGFYTSATKEMVTWKQNVPGFLGITLLHEAGHAIMDAHYRDVPLWVLEGSADYFAFALHPPGELNQQQLRQRWLRLNQWRREQTMLPLENLLNADGNAFKLLDPERAYTMSWSLFQMLMSSEPNRRLMNTLLLQRQDPAAGEMDCTKQLDQLHPGGLKSFETSWHRWIATVASSTNSTSRTP